MLVDDLRLAVAREENAEAVEGGHVALELDPVLEKHRHGNLMVLKVTEKHLLNRLGPLYCHVGFPSPFLFTAETLGMSCRSSSSLTKWPWLSNLRQPRCVLPAGFTCSKLR